MNCPICNEIIYASHWHTLGKYEVSYRDENIFLHGTYVYTNNPWGESILNCKGHVFLDEDRIEIMLLLK